MIRNYDYGKILILDDFQLFHQGLVIVLESASHLVINSVDDAAAIDIANRERPDFIITDMSLPVKSGWEVIEELRSGDVTQGTPIVALSGHVFRGGRDTGHEEGCDAYIGKSVDNVASLQAIDGLLEFS